MDAKQERWLRLRLEQREALIIKLRELVDEIENNGYEAAVNIEIRQPEIDGIRVGQFGCEYGHRFEIPEGPAKESDDGPQC